MQHGLIIDGIRRILTILFVMLGMYVVNAWNAERFLSEGGELLEDGLAGIEDIMEPRFKGNVTFTIVVFINEVIVGVIISVVYRRVFYRRYRNPSVYMQR